MDWVFKALRWVAHLNIGIVVCLIAWMLAEHPRSASATNAAMFAAPPAVSAR